jgi:membrane protein
VIAPGAAVAAVRARRPFVDHLVRAYQRYQADTGDRLAAAVTFYWFLSLFPILLIAVYVTSQVLGDDAGRQVTDGLQPYLGAPTAKAVGDVVQNSAAQAGLIGLAGTLLTGLGWIDGLRDAIRTIWHQNVTAGNIVTRRVVDAVVLVGLFAVIAASVVFSTAATAATGQVLRFLGLAETPAATVFTQLLSYGIGAVIDTGIFLYLFVRLAKVPTPLRQVIKGAVFGAVGFEVLKFVGAFYVGRTTTQGEATYGTFAVVVGLLLFLNLVSRLLLFTAAFVVTAPYDSDVPPSGTSDAEQARRAGIPPEYAGTGLNLREDGAPTPLRAAVQGRIAPQDQPEGTDVAPERSWAGRRPGEPQAPPEPEPDAVPALQGAEQVQRAARVTLLAGGALLSAVAVYVLRTLARLVRR